MGAQVKEISSLSQDDITQLIGAEAQPEVDRLASYFQNVQRSMAALLEMQTASCLQTCNVMANLLQDAGQCYGEFGTRNTAAETVFDSKLKAVQQVKSACWLLGLMQQVFTSTPVGLNCIPTNS